MSESDSAATISDNPLVRKSDRVDSPTHYASWRDYAFSDDVEPAPTSLS